jgi:hypothetical protein
VVIPLGILVRQAGPVEAGFLDLLRLWRTMLQKILLLTSKEVQKVGMFTAYYLRSKWRVITTRNSCQKDRIGSCGWSRG